MELSYTSLGTGRLNISRLGLSATAVSTAFMIFPVIGLATTFYLGEMIRSSGCDFNILTLIRAAITAQNALFFILPAVGLAMGIAGIAVSGKRCVLSAMAAAFNGVMLMFLVAASTR